MNDAVLGSLDLQSALSAGGKPFAFPCQLSLRPLIDFWTKGIASEQSLKGALGQLVERELRKVPELLEPIEDLALIARHRELVDTLMAPVFPSAFWDREYGAALIPFHLRSFYATPLFERMLTSDGGTLSVRVNADEATATGVRLRHAYALILRQAYGLAADVEGTLVFIATDPDTGLDRYFKTLFDPSFLEVVTAGALPPLPRGQSPQALLADPRRLLELIPPESFVIRGFTVFKAVEVTDQEVISALKRDLIEKESIVSNERFQTLQTRLRTLLRRPDLQLGLAAINGDEILLLNSGARLEHACIFADSAHHTVAEFAGSIFDRAARQREPLIVDDLAAIPGRAAVEEEILQSGLRSMVIAPLRYQDELIGMLDLGAPAPGSFDAGQLARLGEVLPLFSMAVKRSMEELETRIQAAIKEKCTAIHPSVEWRFRKAVLRGIERARAGGVDGGPGDMEPIVFDGVYPLYGLSDIRGSSTQRALAIQSDLLAHLGLAADVLRAAHQLRPLPALDELAYRTAKHVTEIETHLRSGDEVALVAFLRGEVEPLFEHLLGFGPEVGAKVEAYRKEIDPRLGTVYRRRKAFEDSVTLINETVSGYLDLEQQAAQGMCPHYFEKQQTDGVDYSIYVGGSLLDHGRFDALYLRNLRLWQLMVTCGIALRAERLKERLAVPLETAHLLLVQHMPLSIRFRFDEKRFDVDGAYNVRYEIIKKRIDKATVRGTHERLTQPGQIAIVYAQSREAAEYRDYLEYLQHLRYLHPEVEDLELDEMQGVQGLRALRVGIELDNPRLEGPVPLVALAGATSAPGGR